MTRLIEAARRFARAATHLRDADLAHAEARSKAAQIEHLASAAAYYAALAELADAERDLILVVREYEREQARGESA
jgi:hypothetical protein